MVVGMVEFYRSVEEKGKILSVKIPSVVKEILKHGKVAHGSIYVDALKHSVMAVDKMEEVKAFIESELIKEYKAVSLGLSPAEGCKIKDLIETMHLILTSPKSKHLKIIIPTTLDRFKTKDAIKNAFEKYFKKSGRKLSVEELDKIYVFPTIRASQHVEGLKKFLG